MAFHRKGRHICRIVKVPHRFWQSKTRRMALLSWTAATVLLSGASWVACQTPSTPPAHHEASGNSVAPGAEAKGKPKDAKTLSATQKALSPAEIEHRQKMVAESTQMLSLAVALKAAVDKTNKDTLSLNVIRRANELERLARSMKEELRQTGGPGS
jgi:hypothetical protein